MLYQEIPIKRNPTPVCSTVHVGQSLDPRQDVFAQQSNHLDAHSLHATIKSTGACHA